MESTLLSVIIPTHNRCDLLIRNLSAFSSQVEGSPRFEVIIVADACEDDTEAKVLEIAEEAPFSIRLLSHWARNAATSRNLGAKHAEGKFLLFLDDDLCPQPGLINAHLESQHLDQVVLGYSKPIYPNPASFWQKNARLWWEDMYRQMRQPGHRFSYRDFFSGNVSLSTELFQRIGGFDDRINMRLEDYEMGIRLLDAGVRFHFVSSALAYHLDETDLTLWLKRSYQEGIADIQIVRRHPKLRVERFGRPDDEKSWKEMRRFTYQSALYGGWISDRIASVMVSLAQICENLKFRKFWWLLIGTLREYYYWRGVRSELGSGKEVKKWILNSPVALKASDSAPKIDLSAPINSQLMRDASVKAEQEGLKILWRGLELLEIPPEPGKEPLNEEHLQSLIQNKPLEVFLPALAIDLIQSSQGEGFSWQTSLLK